ncbi:MAG: hypothetical protein JWP35_4668 [Caulobacter sp.]|nr:hypothetical protein [Caulobacter sp.]
MASRYYGVDVGGQLPQDVTQGAATTSKKIELAVDLTATNLNKLEVLKALEALSTHINVNIWPPA